MRALVLVFSIALLVAGAPRTAIAKYLGVAVKPTIDITVGSGFILPNVGGECLTATSGGSHAYVRFDFEVPSGETLSRARLVLQRPHQPGGIGTVECAADVVRADLSGMEWGVSDTRWDVDNLVGDVAPTPDLGPAPAPEMTDIYSLVVQEVTDVRQIVLATANQGVTILSLVRTTTPYWAFASEAETTFLVNRYKGPLLVLEFEAATVEEELASFAAAKALFGG